MDSFICKLVERLFDPSQPLSRNRHFHTFDNPQGRKALSMYRRLKALKLDVERCHRDGGKISLQRTATNDEVRIELTLDKVRGRRTTVLDEDELRLLKGLVEVQGLLG